MYVQLLFVLHCPGRKLAPKLPPQLNYPRALLFDRSEDRQDGHPNYSPTDPEKPVLTEPIKVVAEGFEDNLAIIQLASEINQVTVNRVRLL